ncbi:hypothetical protein SH139x_004723 [Planctomycetaceae bacterium SH139]
MQATGIFGTAVGTICFLLIILIWYLEINFFSPFDGPSSNDQFFWNNIVMPLLAFLLSVPLAAVGACLWFVGFLGGMSVFKDPTSSRDDKRLAAVTAGVPGGWRRCRHDSRFRDEFLAGIAGARVGGCDRLLPIPDERRSPVAAL